MQQQALLPQLDEAHQALQACTTDFARLRIRDTARAVQAAAAVLGRRDIQVMAAELVGDAERAIAQANPPQLRKSDRVTGIGVTPGHGNFGYVGELSRDVVRKIRQAHAIPDADYERVKAEHRERCEPLTRAALAAEVRRGRKAQQGKPRGVSDEPPPPLPDAVRLIPAAVADLIGHVEPESVDAIVTDPPYTQEFVDADVYNDLALFAAYALRPGGQLIAFAGHAHFPPIFRQMTVDGLRYQWTLAYRVTQRPAVNINRGISKVGWKPLIWYVKPPVDGSQVMGPDVLDAPPIDADREHHDWGQSVEGMKLIIQRLKLADGALICDPFAGGGSTLLAARQLGHPVIGADIDPDAVAVTQRRLAA